jgi:hypothetical protein
MDILTIADGEQITAPGAYRTSMDWYHTQAICPGPSVSSTGLRKIALQSPHAFWKTWEGNPDRYPPKEPGDALILGKAAHCLILGDEVFDENFFYVEDGAPRRPTAPQVKAFDRDGKWSDAAAEGAAYWEDADKRAAGKHLITAEQITKIKYMAENLAANPLAVECLKSDLIEISMIWQDEQTGIWVKSRPDCIPTNAHDFGDLKTMAPKGSDLHLAVQRATTDHGYPMQMALAVMGAERVFGTTAKNCALVFCQSTEPYDVIPLIIDEDALYWARVLCRHGLNKMAGCLKTNDWPGAGVDLLRYSYPPRMAERFSEMQSNGELPNV